MLYFFSRLRILKIMPSPSKSKVYFFFQDVRITIPAKKRLMKFVESIFKKEGRALGYINYIFCSDESLLKVNRKYLGRSYYTDIISFDLSETKNQISAEVYISVPRVKENATFYGTAFKSELYRVLFHGALHFCGYNDKSKNEIKKMRRREDFYLDRYII